MSIRKHVFNLLQTRLSFPANQFRLSQKKIYAKNFFVLVYESNVLGTQFLAVCGTAMTDQNFVRKVSGLRRRQKVGVMLYYFRGEIRRCLCILQRIQKAGCFSFLSSHFTHIPRSCFKWPQQTVVFINASAFPFGDLILKWILILFPK